MIVYKLSEMIMINFPTLTECSKIVAKDKFYKNEAIPADILAEFKRDIIRITHSNKLSADTLGVAKSKDIDEIVVLTIEMQRKKYEQLSLEIIAHQMEHNTLFILQHDNDTSFALYVEKIYATAWQDSDLISFDIQGNNLDEVWENIVLQVIVDEKLLKNNPIDDNSLTLTEKIKMYEEKQQLQNDITGLKKRIRNTDDFNKREDLKQLLAKLEERL